MEMDIVEGSGWGVLNGEGGFLLYPESVDRAG
jgi:hypothetical protein